MATKRGYGSGSLKVRGTIWYYRFYDRTGKRIEGSTGHTDKKKAQLVLAERLTKENGGTASFAAKVSRGVTKFTVGDLLDKYMNTRSTELGNDRYVIEKSLKPFFASTNVTDLTTQDTVEYRKFRRESPRKSGDNAKPDTKRAPKKPLSNSTIDRELRILKAAIRSLWKQGDPLVRNPIYVHITNEDNKRRGFISPKDFISNLMPLFPAHIVNLATLLFCSGMRSGEALNLDRTHIDMESGVLYVIDSKNGESREVPIFDGLMRECLERQLRYCEVNSPNCPALFTCEGKRISYFRRSWASAAQESNFKDLRPHDLRRSAAKNMRNADIPGSIIMEIMGHNTQSMLERYGIIDANDIKTAKEKMNVKAAEWKTYKTA